MSLLFISNSYATHFLTKKARAVCTVSQDIDLIMNWKHDYGSWALIRRILDIKKRRLLEDAFSQK